MENKNLRNGVSVPSLLFGTWNLDPKAAKQIILDAFDSGYVGLDCAYSYGNDFYIGKAVKESGIPRDNLFIINKVWNAFRGEIQVVEACKKSLKLMKLSYFDLYLVHWPVAVTNSNWKEINRSTWAGVSVSL